MMFCSLSKPLDVRLHGVLVQIALWTMVGFFAFWIVPHLPDFVLTGWRAIVTVIGFSILQWFALFMIIQYVWTIVRATLSTGLLAARGRFGSRGAQQVLDDAPRLWQSIELKRTLNAESNPLKEKE
jgi:hypothetical protein